MGDYSVGNCVFLGSWIILAYFLWLCNPLFCVVPLLLFVYSLVVFGGE